MKSIVFIPTLVLILAVLSQEGYGCDEHCACPSLFGLVNNPQNATYTEQAGCNRTLICPAGENTYISSRWDYSEIAMPIDAEAIFYANTNKTEPTVDMFTYFGMICEKNTWYITKYPAGISYGAGGPDLVTLTDQNLLSGSKSNVTDITCG